MNKLSISECDKKGFILLSVNIVSTQDVKITKEHAFSDLSPKSRRIKKNGVIM